jgi:hypothetical protein
MQLDFRFSSPEQEKAFYLQKRNQCICGGYGSGKTFVCCLKLILLALEFPGYRVAMIRRERVVLMKTTYETFKGILGASWDQVVETDDRTNGVTTFKNGSTFLWLGLDRFDVNNLKSLELNASLMDQGEEMDETIYTHLDARLDRWSNVTVPAKYANDPAWRRNPFTGKPMAPCYNLVVCNPDLETHWIWREFHPDSQYWQVENNNSHDYIVIPSTANGALSPENLKVMMKKDPQWVRRFVYGEWGNSDAQIHHIPPESEIEPPHEWLENFLEKALLYRLYDHGETSPSCCLWLAVYKGIYLFYREYYMPGKLISYHRQAIADLSGEERYSGEFADPEIFKKKSQNAGGRYCVADEYKDFALCKAPPIYWRLADNNEMGTRNRINELLQFDESVRHPITGEQNAPHLYFIKRGALYPNGCYNSLVQTKSQRREKIDEVQGKVVYSDDRDKNVVDHAYDPVRYGIAIHARKDDKNVANIAPNSFMALHAQYSGRKAAYTGRRHF